MNTTVPADPRLRKRALIIALTMTLVGLVSLYLFRRFLYEMEALAHQKITRSMGHSPSFSSGFRIHTSGRAVGEERIG